MPAMMSRTVQITTTSTSPTGDGSLISRRSGSSSFWDDAYFGTSTIVRRDSHDRRSSNQRSDDSSSNDGDHSVLSWLNLSTSNKFDGILASVLRSALMGAAAALGYHLTSAATRHVLRFIEQRFSSGEARYEPLVQEDNVTMPISESLINLRAQIRSQLREIIVRLVRKIRIRARHLRASLGTTWPLWLALASSWPHNLQGGNAQSILRPTILQRWVLGPIMLGWLLCARDDEGDHGDEEDDNNDNNEGGTPSRSNRSNLTTPARYESASDYDRIRSGSVISQTSASATQTPLQLHQPSPSPKTTTGTGCKQQRYLEMLVHNVSHTDLILGIGLKKAKGTGDTLNGMKALMTPRRSEREQMSAEDTKGYVVAGGGGSIADTDPPTSADPDDLNEKYALCRPRFSAFDLFSRRVLDSVRSKLILGGDAAQESGNALLESMVSFPRYERSDASQKYNLVTPRVRNRERTLPVGFDLGGEEDMLAVRSDEVPSLRVRGRDVGKMGSSLQNALVDANEANASDIAHPSDDSSGVAINGVFFPLLSILMRRWHADIADKYDTTSMTEDGRKVKKVVVLVSGVGSPRNWTHSIAGNSTQACSELMEIFIKVMYPDVIIVRIHSDTNIFRYDENISFAKEELLPKINAYRDAHARGEPYPDELQTTTTPDHGEFDPDWKQTFSVALSFADGSPARTHAIQTSLRHTYRPTFYHFWQLKTFWHDSKLSDEDIEVHPFEEMETVPAMDVAKISDNQVQLVIEEMRAFRKHFLETLDENSNDIKSFWLRKTKKPVLAVLLVADAKNGGKPKLYRGTNMEVSMPTGSLCAERNVIGTALATNPGLKREDLRMVAVLALPLGKDEPGTSPYPPQVPSPPPGFDLGLCAIVGSGDGASKSVALQKKTTSADSSIAGSSFPEGKQFLSQIQQKLAAEPKATQSDAGNMRRSYSTTSFSSIIEEKRSRGNSKGDEPDEDDDSPLSWTMADAPKADKSAAADASTISSKPGVVAFHESIDLTRKHSNSITSPPGTPMRKIKLNTNSNFRPTFGRGQSGSSKSKRTVVVHSPDDINPLKPCGACNEWLKKIAESNPYFRVLTFTDADCNGVYVTPVLE